MVIYVVLDFWLHKLLTGGFRVCHEFDTLIQIGFFGKKFVKSNGEIHFKMTRIFEFFANKIVKMILR